MVPVDARPLLYVVLAGCLLWFALTSAREALVSLGVLVRAAAAIAGVGLAAAAAVVFAAAAVIAR